MVFDASKRRLTLILILVVTNRQGENLPLTKGNITIIMMKHQTAPFRKLFSIFHVLTNQRAFTSFFLAKRQTNKY